MDTLTFDRSPALGLALVAREDFSRARYIPLEDAPAKHGTAAPAYLCQLHGVAHPRILLQPGQWLLLAGI